MISVHKKIIVNEQGKPTDVIIPWEEYKEIEESLGLDLEDNAIEAINQAKQDRENGKEDAYLDLESI